MFSSSLRGFVVGSLLRIPLARLRQRSTCAAETARPDTRTEDGVDSSARGRACASGSGACRRTAAAAGARTKNARGGGAASAAGPRPAARRSGSTHPPPRSPRDRTRGFARGRRAAREDAGGSRSGGQANGRLRARPDRGQERARSARGCARRSVAASAGQRGRGSRTGRRRDSSRRNWPHGRANHPVGSDAAGGESARCRIGGAGRERRR